ncbi:MAG: hypothetical protein AB7F35_14730 [Acetobacteraceae bacterium]
MTFSRAIGIDYSGARTPMTGLPGLRVYLAEGDTPAVEVPPPPSRRRHWTRRGIAEYLVATLAGDRPTVVGIDHAFSFPLAYFEEHGLPRDWPGFLDDFQHHWPTDGDATSVEDIRRRADSGRPVRWGSARWRRLTDRRSGGAKSVFHFDVQGSVAKSTHAGLPWLRFIRQRLGDRVHVWPFDGWEPPDGRSVIAEVYPALWNRSCDRADRTPDQHDAWCVASWLAAAARSGELQQAMRPALPPEERQAAEIEGWILGVPGRAHP